MNLSIKKSDLCGWIISGIIVLFSSISGLNVYLFPSTSHEILLLLICCLLYFRVIFKRPLRNICLTGILILLMFFVLRNSLYLVTAGSGIVSLLTYFIMFLLCYYSQYDGIWIEKTLRLFSIIYFIYCFCTIWFYFDSSLYLNYIVDLFPDTRDRLIEWYNSGCMAGLTNHYSTNGMFIASGLIIYCCHMLKYKKKSKMNYFLIVFAIISLLLTGKRGHILFAAGALFTTYYIYTGRNKRNRWQKVFGILFIVFCGFGILLTAVPQLSTFVTRFQESMDSGDITNNRKIFWTLAIQLFKNNPILGIGWNRFRSFSESILNYSAHAHNIYIQLLCETGILGFITYITWIIFMLYKGIENFILLRKKSINSGDYSLYHMAFSVAYQVFFVLYGFTGNPLYDEETFIVYFVACAITIYYESNLSINNNLRI